MVTSAALRPWVGTTRNRTNSLECAITSMNNEMLLEKTRLIREIRKYGIKGKIEIEPIIDKSDLYLLLPNRYLLFSKGIKGISGNKRVFFVTYFEDNKKDSPKEKYLILPQGWKGEKKGIGFVTD
ncbi:MAG: hypothetical protein KKG60_00600 [Nanoarchaeota archaeon]|nr:hypothetical protein [Nanoarchaeota archaeon]